MSPPSYLGLEGQHAFITGAAGGIGHAVVNMFLSNGCKVTAFDKRRVDVTHYTSDADCLSRLFVVEGDMTSAQALSDAFSSSSAALGPPNILIANAGITDESSHPPIWDVSEERWNDVYNVNIKGTFLTIKHFLNHVKEVQEATGREIENVAIVVTGSETGVFGQEGHSEYASGKAGLQYGLVRTVKNEIVRLNSKARINAVAPSWVNTALIGDRLDDPKELWAECHATSALRKIAQPTDVANAMLFLASQRAAGHISGQCISIDGGMEGRLLWREPLSSPGTKP